MAPVGPPLCIRPDHRRPTALRKAADSRLPIGNENPTKACRGRPVSLPLHILGISEDDGGSDTRSCAPTEKRLTFAPGWGRIAREDDDGQMITNLTTGETMARRVVRCDTFWKRGRGLMFRRRSAVEDTVYLFVEKKESVAATTIHMFFVFFPIAVIWLDAEKRVVDKKLARPFRPYYAPRRPARYFLEGDPALLDKVRLGDRLAMTNDR